MRKFFNLTEHLRRVLKNKIKIKNYENSEQSLPGIFDNPLFRETKWECRLMIK